MIVAFASLEPEPLQAAPQVDHRTGIPAAAAGRRNAALVQCLGHRVARHDALALQLRDRAGHVARKGVCPRLNGRLTSQASFRRKRLAHDHAASEMVKARAASGDAATKSLCWRPSAYRGRVATPCSFKTLAILLLDLMPSRSSAAIVSAMLRAKASARA